MRRSSWITYIQWTLTFFIVFTAVSVSQDGNLSSSALGLHSDGYIFTTFDYPGASGTAPYGINNNGQISGYYDPPGSTNCQPSCSGFLYDNGRFSAINVPNATTTLVYGLNNQGDIVGFADVPSGYDNTGKNGFLYSGGSFTYFSILPQYNTTYPTVATGVNSNGDIVGWDSLFGPPCVVYEFYFSQGQFLGNTCEAIGSSEFSVLGLGVNDAGNVIGYVAYFSGGTYAPLAATTTLKNFGVFSNFSYPHALETYGYGINNEYEMVGTYRDASKRSEE